MSDKKYDKKIEKNRVQEEKKRNKQRIAEIKEKQKEMSKEMDQLKGETTKGKIMAVIIGILLMILIFGGIAFAIKMDAGGVASNTLAPVIGDVPVARSILPKKLQKKNASEIQAEKKVSRLLKMQQNSRKKLRQKQRHPPLLKREQQQKHKLWQQHLPKHPQELRRGQQQKLKKMQK